MDSLIDHIKNVSHVTTSTFEVLVVVHWYWILCMLWITSRVSDSIVLSTWIIWWWLRIFPTFDSVEKDLTLVRRLLGVSPRFRYSKMVYCSSIDGDSRVVGYTALGYLAIENCLAKMIVSGWLASHRSSQDL